MKKHTYLKKLMNFWPPFLGAGIHVKNISDDGSSVDVEMKLHWWNKNRVDVHFGGSIYAMTDPFFMLILMEQLGKDYIVWDKAATVRFKKPGTGKLSAHFNIAAEKVAEIKAAADSQYKVEPTFTVEVKNEQGEVVAEVDKLLYVRRKDHVPRPK